MIVEDPILTAFSYLFLIWFIFLVVAEIFYSARKKPEKAKTVLYAGFILSLLAAAGLTIYTAYFVQNIHEIGYLLVSFIGNFILWISPVIIAALIYLVYSWKNNQKPKEPENQKSKDEPKNMSSSIYGNSLKKE
ncbi:hypothetical protein [Methanimicrococcus blatticola]|uniref:Uncharacterized protein n=1 Tax=Methanimicrococcus blatticola TaxID=91560 RepID=A0A484F7H1_9EURY|nr:hypothetical protein [Methanimicrococcus blatticola]MBZ3934912.1 hypothetical protein [Methanimicrococcus blatticola]MCC2508989.1 hypothetical protein [Methanimicrococcus blatticola]TDQ70981.1 hypothetical protein C7391_0079 [Methanimicrococcus blatticola]